jgi:hypothetical protein
VPPERARTYHKKKGTVRCGGIAEQNAEPARVAWNALLGRPLKKSPWPTRRYAWQENETVPDVYRNRPIDARKQKTTRPVVSS